jgi:hypothetical protein
MRSQTAITLSADDVKFLSGCGVLQEDIKVIPKLPSDGQDTISMILASSRKKCSSQYIQDFIATRDYWRKFTPIPSVIPMPPPGYKQYFLTDAEQEFIARIIRSVR